MRTDEETDNFIYWLDELTKIPIQDLENKTDCMLRLFEIPDDNCEDVGEVSRTLIGKVEAYIRHLPMEQFINVYINGFIIAYQNANDWIQILFLRLSKDEKYQAEFERQLLTLDKQKKNIFTSFYTRFKSEKVFLDYEEYFIRMLTICS